MTFRLTKTFRFEASHQLPHHDGKCARLHGHSWVARVTIAGNDTIQTGPKAGMVMDFSEMKSVVDPIIQDHLDHYHLNESTGLENPTSEEVARWLFSKLDKLLPHLHSVTIDETCTSSCEYGTSL